MLRHFDPYRPIVLYLLLLSYGWIAFQYPISEAFHFLAHSPEMSQVTYQYHVHDGSELGHYHRYMILLKDAGEEPDSSDDEYFHQELKKEVEIVDLLNAEPLPNQFTKLYNFKEPILGESIFLPIIAPPPQLV